MTYKIGQTFCLPNWVQDKGPLSMFSIVQGAFIRRNIVFLLRLILHKKTHNYLFTTQSRLLTTLRKKALKKTVGKRENAFLLFPWCFLANQREKSSF